MWGSLQDTSPLDAKHYVASYIVHFHYLKKSTTFQISPYNIHYIDASQNRSSVVSYTLLYLHYALICMAN
jgi:hypothetical protein